MFRYHTVEKEIALSAGTNSSTNKTTTGLAVSRTISTMKVITTMVIVPLTTTMEKTITAKEIKEITQMRHVKSEATMVTFGVIASTTTFTHPDKITTIKITIITITTVRITIMATTTTMTTTSLATTTARAITTIVTSTKTDNITITITMATICNHINNFLQMTHSTIIIIHINVHTTPFIITINNNIINLYLLLQERIATTTCGFLNVIVLALRLTEVVIAIFALIAARSARCNPSGTLPI